MMRSYGFKDQYIAPISTFFASLWLKHDRSDDKQNIIICYLLGKLMDFVSVQLVDFMSKDRRCDNEEELSTVDVHVLTIICLIGSSINFGTGIGKADNLTKLMYRFLMKFCLLETKLPIKTF